MEVKALSPDDMIYVNEDAIDEDLLCMICTSPLFYPIEHIPCGKPFCNTCFEKVQNCPNCRNQVLKHQIRPITLKFLLNPLNDLKVICGRCDKQFIRGEIEEHHLNCFKGKRIF